MDLREQLRRRRKDTRFILGGLAALLFVLTFLYYFIQRSQELPAELVTNRVLLFVLWYVNVVLILAILFVLIRNLIKVWVERRHKILGSKFKTKLVATYIGLSLLPVMLLFFYGTSLLHGWIDRWFDEPAIRQIHEQGNAVAQDLQDFVEKVRLRDAKLALKEIRSFDLKSARQRPQLGSRLQDLLNEQDLDFLAVFDGTEFVHAVLNPLSEIRDLPEPGDRFLREVMQRGDGVRLSTPSGSRGRLVLVAAAQPDSGGGVRPIVVAGTYLSPELANRTESLIQAYQGYKQLEVRKSDIEAGYFLTFLMVTLLILLAVSWVGIYLARRVTVPIQALAEGTRRISGGELDFRVDVAADDEFGVLVDSFNHMTSELQRNKVLLEESNRELLEANERLADERAVIAAVLHNLASGVISVDPDGKILTCNGAALAMLRQTEAEVVGLPMSEAWSDPERRKLALLFDEEPPYGERIVREVRLILVGEWRTFEAKVTGMRSRDGGTGGRIMVLEELTELVQAQQVAAWSEAARRIAHEIKNPLTPIKLSAERLLRKYQQRDESFSSTLEEGVDIIVREVESMKGMVDEFSRFARMRRPQPAEVNLGKLITETLHLYNGIKPGVEIEGEVNPAARIAWIDSGQVKQALINLVDNSLDAVAAPGKVRVEADKINGTLLIRISDTGQGIPPEVREKLFLPYFSTKGRGTGLGLSIVHRIVSDHHGRIQISDNQPHGTVFTLEFPQP